MVKQTIITYRIRSKGEDNVQNYLGDFDIGMLAATLSEEAISDEKTGSSIKQFKTTSSSGAISGTISDVTGAVIPGAVISAKNQNSEETFTAKTNDSGQFLIKNLPSGMYRITASATGFSANSVSNVVVSSMTRIELNLQLEVGGSTAMVNVDSSETVTLDSTNTRITTNVTKADSAVNLLSSNSPKFTPRVREYFPETLVWKPEIITDKKGRAEIKFKLADSLTTWKLYVIGSTQTGEIEMFEKELQTFQPFFAELDPPKILTTGDEISLPVPIRNYTKKNQKVSVEMTKNNWSSVLNGANQQIKIGANSTKNAIFNFRATSPIENGKQKVTATAKKEGDAIEKSITVKPNGKKEIDPQSKFFEKETKFDVSFPAEAFPNTKKAIVKIYPNMLSHVAESVEGLLKRPYGCGEQTTSSTYPNLMILKFADDSESDISPSLKKKAEGFLQDGYKRLLNYQTDTGFGYWSGSSPDVALTAYILQFLNDSEDFIEVDETVIKKAEKWLLSQQKADGSWGNRNSRTTAYVARSLSISTRSDKEKQEALQKAFTYLKNNLSTLDDSYILANLALAAVNIKDFDTANKVFEKLLAKGNLPIEATRTAFYGSGTSAKIETIAIILQALLKSQRRDENLISKGLRYLLEKKDEHGVWFSTQTTVNVLNTLILFQELQKDSKQNVSDKAEIYVNGVKIKEFEINNKGLNNPFSVNISESLVQTNSVEIKGFANIAMAQVVATHYIDWSLVKEDFSDFDLKVNYNKTYVEIGEEIICKVELQRKRRSYGMILAEIGIPPGADVDRATLDKLVRDKTISRYDVLPDKVVIYAWAGNELKNFSFSFKSRYGIKAQTSPSIVYDYYNEEAKATIAPILFEVK